MPDDFFDLSNSDPITEFVLPIVAGIRGEYEICGSGIVLCEGLLLTAKHILDWAGRTFCDQPLPPLPETEEHSRFQSGFSLQVLQKVNDGKSEAVWDVLSAAIPSESDLALLHLTPRNEEATGYKWRSPSFTFALPAIGSDVSAVGYHSPVVTTINNGPQDLVKLAYKLSTSRGVVVEVHGLQRDQSRLKFPCFRFDARLESTMSGGPIFNLASRVCGLICQTMKPGEPSDPHVSYGTALWPLLGAMVQIPTGEVGQTRSCSVYDLVTSGLVSGIGLNRLKVTKGDDGRVLSIEMRVPRSQA